MKSGVHLHLSGKAKVTRPEFIAKAMWQPASEDGEGLLPQQVQLEPHHALASVPYALESLSYTAPLSPILEHSRSGLQSLEGVQFNSTSVFFLHLYSSYRCW